MVPAIIGALGMLGAAGVSAYTSSKANSSNASLNKKQLELSREQFDYQKALNQQVMEREDNAYQRASVDMQKAGLNPLTLSSGSSASTMSAGSPMSAGNQSMQPVQSLDPNTVANFASTLLSNQTSKENAVLSNATNESIAQMQQRGVNMANAYNYEVGMANAYANQIKAITDYRRSGVNDPEVLKALKQQLISEAKSRQTESALLEQEYQGRSKAGTYRGMSQPVQTKKELVDEVTDALDSVDKKSSGNVFKDLYNAFQNSSRARADAWIKKHNWSPKQ